MDLATYRAALAAKFRQKAASLRALIAGNQYGDDNPILWARANELEWAAEAVEKDLGATAPAVTP